ncbi:MAG: hypothetical protein GWM92_00910 [Gemmatimonadetes bacterium]|nr:hypothetical protein [Gemmatimonadota bacterium]NIR77013.1 hypothetical protein [Gemmatimonadota bacterium]NIT85542.1 hypothetical protein [Gemmatimonadota bacterium]NIU29368.1 hypothetical protein [Gemmatimonadota bacterium]NIU34428.1 hypothetical protein [Gemmatimonadota bacterium]
MSLSTLLMILGAVAAFAYGVWAGLGRWDQSPEEIERALDEDRPRRRAARHLTPLDLMSKVTGVQIHRDWSRAFRFERNEKEDDEDAGPVGEGDGAKEGAVGERTTEQERGGDGDGA